jgi:hypothetical protein
MTLVVLPDRRDEDLIVDGAHSTNLDETVDWRVNESEKHDSWRVYTNIKAFERISKAIQCILQVAV